MIYQLVTVNPVKEIIGMSQINVIARKDIMRIILNVKNVMKNVFNAHLLISVLYATIQIILEPIKYLVVIAKLVISKT